MISTEVQAWSHKSIGIALDVSPKVVLGHIRQSFVPERRLSVKECWHWEKRTLVQLRAKTHGHEKRQLQPSCQATCGISAENAGVQSRQNSARLIHHQSENRGWHQLPGAPKGFRCCLCFETDFATRTQLAEHLVRHSIFALLFGGSYLQLSRHLVI
jgi:hypothetical protein